jgi:hypothetical protein
MRRARYLTCLLAVAAAVAGNAVAAPPQLLARTPLSALPPAQSVGQAGPINRIAFDVDGFGPPDTASQVTCIYPDRTRYRCEAQVGQTEPGSTRRRVIVTVPDLGKGASVTVRFAGSGGQADASVQLANAPQVVHEIEALALPGGGQTAIGANGAPVPVMTLVSSRATTTPAMAAAAASQGASCDQLLPEWVAASATDPVFQSPFGALNGSIILAKPVQPGSRVRPDNLPEWQVSYPLSATRAQFIAHYEVIYRVGACPQKVIAPGS